MTTLLHLDASARGERSLSRRLSRRFVDRWLDRHRDGRVIRRDLTIDPPPYVTEAWIAAAFTVPEQRDAAMQAALAWSDAAIAELEAADLLVIGTPMYNYGMPAVLKAWFDQVIRIGRTFSFDLQRGDWPIAPILAGRQLVVVSTRGEFGFAPGGVRDGFNHLDPHLATCAALVGFDRDAIHTIAVEYQEFGDERHAHSVADAEAALPALVDELPSQ